MSTIDPEKDANTQSSTGIALAIVASVLISASLYARISMYANAGGEQVSPNASQWKARADKSLNILFAGYVLFTYAIASSIAGVAMPWGIYISPGSSAAASSAVVLDPFNIKVIGCQVGSCTTTTGANTSTMGLGGIIVLIAVVLFTSPAWIFAGNAVLRVMRVVKFQVLPGVVGNCLPSITTIQGLGWFSCLIHIIGVAIINQGLGTYSVLPAYKAKDGGGFTISGLIALILGNILFTYAATVLGNLPGVGRSYKNACFVERNITASPDAAPASVVTNSVPTAIAVSK
jgi:hypothetical protein